MTTKTILCGCLFLLLSTQLSSISASCNKPNASVSQNPNATTLPPPKNISKPENIYRVLDGLPRTINTYALDESNLGYASDELFKGHVGKAIRLVSNSFIEMIKVNSKAIKACAYTLREGSKHIKLITRTLKEKLGKVVAAVITKLKDFLEDVEDQPYDVVGKFLSFSAAKGMNLLVKVYALTAGNLLTPSGTLIRIILDIIINVFRGIVKVVHHSEKIVGKAFPE